MLADPLVWLRVGVGVAAAWHAASLWPDVHALFVAPAVRLPLPGLGAWMVHGEVAARALVGGVGALGLWTAARPGRWAPALLAVALLALLAQDAALYLNHVWLMVVLAALLAVLPSVGWGEPVDPRAVQLARFQVAVPYVFAGLAKLDPDWLRGSPLDLRLPGMVAAFGPAAATLALPWWMSVASLALDLVCPLMLWFGVRPALAWGVLLAFHLLNSGLFHIGVFPWMMLWVTPVLLPDDTWRGMAAALRGRGAHAAVIVAAAAAAAAVAVGWPREFNVIHPLVGAWGGAVLGWLVVRPAPGGPAPAPGGPAQLPAAIVAAWVFVQVVVPLRHLAIPGDVAWTEEGHRFSWRMLLRVKRVDEALFEVTAPGQQWYVRADALLAPHQLNDGIARADLVWALARHIEAVWAAEGHGDVEVRVRARVSLNGRPAAWMFDPTVDLTRAELPWTGATWILPTPRERWW